MELSSNVSVNPRGEFLYQILKAEIMDGTYIPDMHKKIEGVLEWRNYIEDSIYDFSFNDEEIVWKLNVGTI